MGLPRSATDSYLEEEGDDTFTKRFSSTLKGLRYCTSLPEVCGWARAGGCRGCEWAGRRGWGHAVAGFAAPAGRCCAGVQHRGCTVGGETLRGMHAQPRGAPTVTTLQSAG